MPRNPENIPQYYCTMPNIAESDVNRKSYFVKNVALAPYGFIYSLLVVVLVLRLKVMLKFNSISNGEWYHLLF